ncbi:MAG: AzlD domain-containing protein [Clostridia bacterium]|nr:AzlD domain-containing protein [Clostridia bacterium]
MSNYIYIAIMLLTTVAIRELPVLLLRKPLENKFLSSFLYYVPYVTLTVMTFPAILRVTDSLYVGAAALLVGTALAIKKVKMFPVAVCCSTLVFVLELI